ncbi:MAG: cytochrome c [Epsilonproteobacteria bacterium]|nr:cytochrome c [Campylobacterota bacterium]
MKKIVSSIFLSSILFINANSSQQSLGSVIYTSCKFCHGFKAEKIYMNQIPVIKNLDIKTLESVLRLYKKGTLNSYGYGAIMKMQMRNIPDDKIPVLAKYIKNL